LIRLRNTAGNNEQDIQGSDTSSSELDQKGIVNHLASEESMYDTPAATEIQSSVDDDSDCQFVVCETCLWSVTVTAANGY
jgi:hypothetical protein